MNSLVRSEPAHLVIQLVRWTLIIVLWVAAAAVFILGLGKFARIFTGDAQFGALDGFQFIDALYGAVVRFILAGTIGYIVWLLLRWHPGEADEDGPNASSA